MMLVTFPVLSGGNQRSFSMKIPKFSRSRIRLFCLKRVILDRQL